MENIDKTAEYFKQLGVRSKDRVAIDLPGMPETIYSLYALNKIGAIPVNIDPRSNAESLKRDLEVIKKAQKSKILNRTLEVEVPDEIFAELENMIK